ncbi:ribonuclease M5 [Clostridium cylindrosporum]|uniref:Ribonuclease M5 n=1 Tax=Clostridium cylindrosporum DSM 605 TaxID=1121307 RepID=A0A0J8DF96_CLOCY|nr:ribonuclease M5 [Clostridium cylindrosporum]KMT22924.1 ribonuclease M5 [Clostridium cylindrosporum DSM 605]
MIKELIVVEGKDDVSAVKRAVDADCIITSGFGITPKILKRIEDAVEKRGVIIFTDPDFPGEKIRKTIASKIKGCKHAYLPRIEGTLNGDIGIENASPESILAALSKVKTEVENPREEFTMTDMIVYRLSGGNDATKRRDALGAILGIGYGNAKQFLSRLNRYSITREEFEKALERI